MQCHWTHLYVLIAPGGPPTDVEGNATSSTEIFVYWQPPEEIDRHGIITSYDIMYSSDDNGSEIIEEHPTTSINLTDLCEFTNYSISVRARTAVGEGPFSDTMFVVTDEDS